MPLYYKSKYKQGYLGGSGSINTILKTEEEKDKQKNVTVMKTALPKEPVKTNSNETKTVNKKISDEKLRRFINFKI